MTDRILVTGGQGFIGRYLVADCLSRGADVFAIGRSPFAADRFTHSLRCGERQRAAPVPFRHALLPQSAYAPSDLNDKRATSAALREANPDVVVHLAGALSSSTPQRLRTTNVYGTRTLMEAIGESGVSPRRIVLGSSCAVYGASELSLPLRESAPVNPSHAYGKSKLASEQIATGFCEERGIDLVIARIFNVIGPGQDDAHFPGRLAAQVTSIANGWEPARLTFGDLTPTRDFIDVRDTARALAHLCFSNSPPKVVNVGTGVETRVGQLLEIALDWAGLTDAVSVQCDGEGRQTHQRHVASFDLLAREGFALHYTVQRSLLDLLAYYRTCFPPERSAAG